MSNSLLALQICYSFRTGYCIVGSECGEMADRSPGLRSHMVSASMLAIGLYSSRRGAPSPRSLESSPPFVTSIQILYIMPTTKTTTVHAQAMSLSLDGHQENPKLSQAEDAIEAEVAYLQHDPIHETEKPYTMNYNTEGLLPTTNTKNELRNIVINSFRTMKSPPSYEACGFTTKTLQSSLRMVDFDDPTKVKDVFYSEVKDLVWSMYPNAGAVEVLEHQV